MGVRILRGLLFIGVIFFFGNSLADQGNHASAISFSENKGQWKSDINYRAKLPGGYLYLEDNTLTYDLWDDAKIRAIKQQLADRKKTDTLPLDRTIQCHAFRVQFLGAREDVKTTGLQKQPGYENYFIGDDRSKWAGYVHSYGKVEYEELYTNIDMQIYARGMDIKYDLIIHPDGNTQDIKVRYEGLNDITLKDQNLYLQTSLGEIKELQPYAYQYKNGERVEVPCRFELDENVVTFTFPSGYHPNRKLVIDPQLVFSTYSGSTSDNWGFTAAFNKLGHVYSGGIVFGSGYPVTSGAYQVNFGGGSGVLPCDIGIIVYDSTGSNRIYATYLGGSSNEFPHSLIANKNNELLIYGTTSSSNFPTTSGAYDGSYNGGSSITVNSVSFPNGSDIFVSKLDVSGSSLLASTFVGGSSNDGMNTSGALRYNYGDEARGEIFVDDSNNCYVASCTRSTNFPTVNAFQPTFAGGTTDGVVFKLDSSLSNMIWSSYLGGSSNDACYSMKIDTLGNIYTTGGTNSSDFPTTSGVLNPSQIGNTDGFVSKIKGDGSSILHATYLGTTNYDQSYFIEIDADNDIYVFGQTGGSYTVTPPSVYSNPNSSQFVHKMNDSLSTTHYSSVVGSGNSTPNISPTAFLVNRCEQVYITGWGGNTNYQGNTNGMPITNGAYQSNTDGSDFYLAVYAPDFDTLDYATYIGGAQNGGEHVDGGTSRFDKNGMVYHGVCGGCGGFSDFPTTPGVWSNTNNSSNCNNAVFKFDLSAVTARLEFAPSDTGCVPFTVDFQNMSNGGVTYIWHLGNDTVITGFDTSYTYTVADTYQVMLVAIDSATCKKADTSYGTVRVYDKPDGEAFGDTTICRGDTTRVYATGGATYSWTPSGSVIDPDSPSTLVAPLDTIVYTVRITNKHGCEEFEQVQVNVEQLPDIAVDFKVTPEDTICQPANFNFQNFSQNGNTFQWDFGDGNTATTFDTSGYYYSGSGTYYVKLTGIDSNTCNVVDSITKPVHLFPKADVTATPETSICSGDSIQLQAVTDDAQSIIWSPAETLSDSTIPDPIATPDRTMTYYVFITDSNGCESSDFTTISVVGEAKADFIADPTITATGNKISFSNKSLNADSYQWDFGDGTTSIEENPQHTYATPDTYNVCLTATNGPGCLDSTCSPVIIREVSIGVPNAFSPNGDGENDILYVKGKGIVELKFQIFNRWGELIFETHDPDHGWDGTYKGKIQEMETYVWKLDATMLDGKEVTREGNVTLLR